MSKRDFGSIKCLVHFDFPYFKEPNDGLDDDVGLETWSKENSSVALYGSQIPYAGQFAPKFGYRCLYSYNGSVIGTNTSGIWNLNSSADYEVEFFVNYPTPNSSSISPKRYLFCLMQNGTSTPLLLLSINDSGYLEMIATGWGINTAVSGNISVMGTWKHVLMRISEERLKIYLEGKEDISLELPEDVTLSVSEVRVGYFGTNTKAYTFYIDEFVFRHSAGSGNPAIPSRPYSGTLDVEKIGGYGTGSDGDVVISASTTINSYGIINTITDSKTFTVTQWTAGNIEPSAGSEVMIHITTSKSSSNNTYPLAGLYAFSHISSLNGTNIELEDEITEENGYDFTLSSGLLSTYYIQIITVPNYRTLTIQSGVTITPLKWAVKKGGGIIVFRVKKNCTVNGNILSHGYGAIRRDYQQMTNSKLIDRFLCSQGGGIFITCGGTFIASASTRIGSTDGGVHTSSNSGAGYGGNGGKYLKSSGNTLISNEGKGGVGGGGGGFVVVSTSGIGVGGNAGSTGTSGGGGGGCGGNGANYTGNNSVGGSGGGGQAKSGGSAGTGKLGDGNSSTYYINGRENGSGQTSNYVYYYGGAGGGAPGGNGGQGQGATGNSRLASFTSGTCSGGIAGACLVLVCVKLKIKQDTISTGGQKGATLSSYNNGGTSGGGGTGFCYISCKKQVG